MICLAPRALLQACLRSPGRQEGVACGLTFALARLSLSCRNGTLWHEATEAILKMARRYNQVCCASHHSTEIRYTILTCVAVTAGVVPCPYQFAVYHWFPYEWGLPTESAEQRMLHTNILQVLSLAANSAKLFYAAPSHMIYM
jgi:hypothetical protein